MSDIIKVTVDAISVSLNSCMKQMSDQVVKLEKENKMLREDLESAKNLPDDDLPDEVSFIH